MKPITITITIDTIRKFAESRNIRHFCTSDDVLYIAADKDVTYRITQQHRNDCGCFGYTEMVVKRYNHFIDTVYDIADNEVPITGKEILANFGFMHLFTSLYDAEHVSPKPDSMILSQQQ